MNLDILEGSMTRPAMTDSGTALHPLRASLAFLFLVALQGMHEMEHVVQVIQRYVLGNPKGAGILGTWVDVEPVHFAYNVAFLSLILLAYFMGGFYKYWNSRRLIPMIAFWFMSFALVFEAYHMVEHIFKIVQFIESGRNGTPGILGHFVNLVWLHFSYNTIAFVPLMVVFFIDGYYRSIRAYFSQAVRFQAA